MASLVNTGGEVLAYVEGEEKGKKVNFWWIRWGLRPLYITQRYVDKLKLKAKL